MVFLINIIVILLVFLCFSEIWRDFWYDYVDVWFELFFFIGSNLYFLMVGKNLLIESIYVCIDWGYSLKVRKIGGFF